MLTARQSACQRKSAGSWAQSCAAAAPVPLSMCDVIRRDLPGLLPGVAATIGDSTQILMGMSEQDLARVVTVMDQLSLHEASAPDTPEPAACLSVDTLAR